VSAGLFELRKDPITGWWVATIVDRDFDRAGSPARDADRRRRRLPELPHPAGDGVRVRSSRTTPST
jgi:hypothetical protein